MNEMNNVQTFHLVYNEFIVLHKSELKKMNEHWLEQY